MTERLSQIDLESVVVFVAVVILIHQAGSVRIRLEEIDRIAAGVRKSIRDAGAEVRANHRTVIRDARSQRIRKGAGLALVQISNKCAASKSRRTGGESRLHNRQRHLAGQPTISKTVHTGRL